MSSLKDLVLSDASFTPYADSFDASCGVECGVVRYNGKKYLAVLNNKDFIGDVVKVSGSDVALCELNVENAKVLMKLFSYTAPVSHRGRPFTVGLGDRLGRATPGQLRAIKKYGGFPVLAQQSIRELNLTNRTYDEVLAAAAFGVFEAGYKDGYGADGDHLKTKEEIKYALGCGYTMITLDCSEHINTKVATYDKATTDSEYALLSADVRSRYESVYANKEFPVVGLIDEAGLKSVVLMFYKAIDHAIDCYEYMMSLTSEVDFELSIDETLTSTDPVAHFIIANEVLRAGVKLTSVAPHFCGEFEKGVDYIGVIADFEREFSEHQAIADYFGSYKLSVHSGSDKFSVMPIVARITKGNVHLKTAGTNWLEAVRALAQKDAPLFRKAYAFAVAKQSEAKKYYHITSNIADAPALESMSDERLPEYLELVPSRQALHIAYGLLLNEEWFNKEFFEFLDKNEEAYYAALERHIGRHLALLTNKG